MNKETEKKRLASIVFEGAPDWVGSAAMDNTGAWSWFSLVILKQGHGTFFQLTKEPEYCENQPETELHWTETLLCRSDYE